MPLTLLPAPPVSKSYLHRCPLINYPGVNRYWYWKNVFVTSSIKMTKVKLIDDVGNFYSFISGSFILSEFSATEEIRLMVF